MVGTGFVFLDFNLPNATTWFYFSFLLAVALFFKFSRLLSMRNWDVVTVFLLVPGFLFLQEARQQAAEKQAAPAPVAKAVKTAGPIEPADPATPDAGTNFTWLGYLWLLGGSGYFLFRCLFDLALVQRPALAPNLTLGGLAWLAGALFVCLIAVGFRPTDYRTGVPVHASPSDDKQVGRESMPLNLAQRPLGFWVKRTFAVYCHLAVVAGLLVIGIRHFQDPAGGMAAGTFYLMLPYTGMYVGQAHHVWPMVLVVWALASYRLPLLAGTLLGFAAGTAYFPALLLPIWLSFYWRRGTGRFLFAFTFVAALCLLVTGIILWLTDDLAQAVREALALPDWQPWKVPTSEGFWTGIHWAFRIPVFIAYLAFVVATAVWPLPKNLAHVIALSAAVLIGTQFWYADQGGVYVLWYLPLLMLLVFRPNLSDRRPSPIMPETDWLTRLGRSLRRGLGRLLRAPQAPALAGKATGR